MINLSVSKSRLLTLAALIPFVMAFSQNPLWMRYPAISPDGKAIIFSYRGDLFKVPASGGTALPLTFHEAYDFNPVWSPDGKNIAFASARNGNFDIYLIPSDGGKPKRLTDWSGHETPYSFTRDGQSVIFDALIQDIPQNIQFPSGVLSELYSVPVTGGRTKMVLPTTAEFAVYDHQGKNMYYQDRKGYEDDWRKHHQSSEARDIWRFNLAAGKHDKLTSFAGEDRNPVVSADDNTIFFLSEKSGTFNVWSFPANDPAQLIQLTRFEKHPVRFLSISENNTLCFGFNGDIYTMLPGRQPEKVNISISLDDKKNELSFEKMSSGATEMELSPDGKEIAFVIRGEVYVTAVDYATTKRITNTPEQERNVSFHPNGKTLLYASERNGRWGIFKTSLDRKEDPNFSLSTVLKEEVILQNENDNFQPAFSPDGKEVAFLENRNTLRVINIETKNIRTILDAKYNYSYADGDQWYEWSPDGKWFLVNYCPFNMFLDEAGLVASSGTGEVVNLTKSGYSDGVPRWMMEGKAMIWYSDRNGLRSHGSWGSQSDVYAMFFDPKTWDRFRLSKQELDILKEKEKKEKEEKEKDKDKDKEKDKKGKDDKSKDTADKKKDEIKLPDPVNIVLDGIEDRVQRLTIAPSNLGDARLTKDGEKLYYLSRFEKGYDLWMTDLKKNETKLLLKLDGGGGGLQFDKEEKFLFFFSGGRIVKYNVAENKREDVAFNAEMYLDKYREREYMFDHIWRQVKEKFYDPGLHGVDWEFYGREYRKFLPSISNNYDFTEMLSEMLGELNASHTGSGYNYFDEKGDQIARLGVFYDWDYTGNGLKIAEVMDKSPLKSATGKITAGDIIEKVDGMEIKADSGYFAYFNHKAGKPTLLSLFRPSSGERWEETVKPISGGQENGLLYQRWVKNRRDETERLSGGRIGYVHVRGMNSESFRETYSETLGRNADKEALIVDTRFNGGGWLHDDLATFLNGEKYVDFYPRGRYFGSEPFNKWNKPSIVIMNESNYSDAHGFPFAYKALDIGKLVGMPVPGTMTAVWWETLIDNTVYFGIPQVGTKDNNGRYLENLQLEPDIKIPNEAEIVITGRDQQIEAAVKSLLEELNQKK